MASDRLILERIAAIQRTVVGVQKAFDDVPRNLNDGDLPAFVNIFSERPSTNQRFEAGRLRKITVFEMNLYVKKASQGFEFEAQQLTIPFIELVENAFFSRRMLQLNDEGLGGVENAEINGVRVGALMYNNALHTGATFYLEVVYTRVIRQM
jgi:hypothetical protein